MAARIAPCCRVKAARELPYIYISICSENNNPRGGGGKCWRSGYEVVLGGPPYQNKAPRTRWRGFSPSSRTPRVSLTAGARGIPLPGDVPTPGLDWSGEVGGRRPQTHPRRDGARRGAASHPTSSPVWHRSRGTGAGCRRLRWGFDDILGQEEFSPFPWPPRTQEPGRPSPVSPSSSGQG